MSYETDGGPAFPHDEKSGQYCQGMTLRDYFAAKAMQAWTGIIAQKGLSDDALETIGLPKSATNFDATAKIAYTIADAMLKERQ